MGKVATNAMSRRKGNGSKLPSAARWSPSASLTLSSSPINGGAFGVQYKHGVQCRTPSRSDRFNGVTGAARGPKGRNRNLPWPPGKKDYKIVCSAFCLFYSFRLLVLLLPAARFTRIHLPRQGGFWVHFISFSLVIPRCRADMQANYCFHLIFMIYLKAKSPQGVRHAKAAYC